MVNTSVDIFQQLGRYVQTLTSIIVLTEASADYLLYGESLRRSVKSELQEVIAQLRSIENRI